MIFFLFHMKNNVAHIFLTLFLLVLLFLLCDPFMLWMPPVAAMLATLGVIIGMSVWVGVVIKEHARDERELMHREHAGRVAYLSGIGVLTLALAVEGSLSHHVDSWVALTLGVMIAVKLVARLYFERYR
jgi:predicted small integral membrane protein